MDVPDRLPYEAADRLFAGTPALDGEHSVQPVYLVAATKPGQSTARPFARVHPRDLLLYQSLVDALREPIESTLGSRDEILAYRMAPIDQDDALSASPRWKDFNDAVRGFASKNPEHYLVQADVSSFYISIRTPELSRRLLESGADGDVVRDLDDLLGAWAADGVQGLPQGLMASSFLANFYLAPIDSVLRDDPSSAANR